MAHRFQTLRALIWCKTYPELSSRYAETVCTGAVLEDGSPIRLYPVPFRYMGEEKRYSLYDWITVPASRSSKDPRPESYKVRSEELRLVEHVKSNPTDGWRARREFVLKDPSWQFGSIEALKAAQSEYGRSMGIVTPGAIENVRLTRKTPKERAEFEAKWQEVSSQRDLFRSEYKELGFLPYDIRISWRCSESCSECRDRPHDMKVLDWGLLELGRRDGWERAKQRMATLADLDRYDFRLFMANFRNHLRTFGIIGMWYPKIPEQGTLL